MIFDSFNKKSVQNKLINKEYQILKENKFRNLKKNLKILINIKLI